MKNKKLLQAHVHGLRIEAQHCGDDVIHLHVRADDQHQSLWGRLRQHIARALFRAGDLCYPGNHNNPLRVVQLVVGGTPSNDLLTHRADTHVREVWPLHLADGQAYYNGFLLHEGVKRHYDGRPARHQSTRARGQEAADDLQVFSPSDVKR